MSRLRDPAKRGVGRVVRVAGGGQQGAGQPVGERGFADALDTGDEPGVMQAAGTAGGSELGFCRHMAE